MKKLLSKIKSKKRNHDGNESPESSLRITNETVAEHRERILAGGRKFKYPHQYPKHRIVAITIVIVVLAITSFFAVCIWQLYGAQNTSKFMYNLTQVLPFPVARVDQQSVRYSDYLMELRSAIHYLSTKEAVNFNSDDGRRQLDYQKRLALNKAIENTHIAKLARQHNISVSDKEVADFISNEIGGNRLGVSEDVYRQVIQDYYDWSFGEYKRSVKQQLLRKKVVSKIDTQGREKAQAILAAIQAGSDFAAQAKGNSDDPVTKVNGGDVGMVAKNTDDPNGLVAAVSKLQVGQVSEVIEGVDGFYILKLLESGNDGVRFAKIFVMYRAFDTQLRELRQNGSITEHIKVSDAVQPNSQ